MAGKNQLCLEEDLNPAMHTYLSFQSINSYCLEEVSIMRLKLVCPHCNKSFEKPASIVKRSKTIYCSKECSYVAEHRRKLISDAVKVRSSIDKYKHRKPHTDETRKKMSETHRNNPNSGVFKEGNSPWNKGKREIYSTETINKMSKASRGRIPWNKGKKGYTIAKKGNIVSENTKNRLSEALKKFQETEKGKRNLMERATRFRLYNLGRKRPKEIIEKIAKSNRGKKRSDETKKKISANVKSQWNDGVHGSGDKAPNWQGGSSFEPYCQKFNPKLKEQIRERDNRTCQLCGTKEDGTKLNVHHVHYDKKNCYPDLISLCKSCHSRTQSNREYYEKLFMDILKVKGMCL